jgi:ATP-dependent exoDNAse (exonuclease V) beta subunit
MATSTLQKPLVIYKASAGSGKTFALVLEYLKVLLGVRDEGATTYHLNHEAFNPDKRYIRNNHRHILAITFTNKATEEMKQRILSQLHELAHDPGESKYLKMLQDDLGCDVDQLSTTAERALNDLLIDYQYFNVSTIDSFFQSILRAFAFELDRQGDYNVEIKNDFAVNSALNTLLDDFNKIPRENSTRADKIDIFETPVGKWIYEKLDYTKTSSNSQKFNAFNRDTLQKDDLTKFAESIFGEKIGEIGEKLFKWLDKNDPSAIIDVIDKKIEELSQRIASRFKTEFDDYLDGIAPGMSGLYKTKSFQAIRKGQFDDSLGADFVKAISNTATNIAVKKELKPKLKEKNLSADEVKAYLNDTFSSIIYPDMDTLNYLSTVRNGIKYLPLLQDIYENLKNFRSENNMVFLADANTLLKKIIGSDDLPFIFERLGVQLTHFLIDEFQDTSRTQWENLKPLVFNGISDYNDSLIIGDVKQSIYRFRNADSTLLDHEVENDVDIAPLQRQKGSASAENTNRRSARQIVLFNDLLFDKLSRSFAQEDSTRDIAPGYENVMQEVAHNDLPGYVHFIPDVKDPNETVHITEETIAEGEHRHFVPTKISEHIMRRLIDEIRGEKERGYKYKDILILTRNNDLGSEIVRYLLESTDIPVTSAESLLLTNSVAVKTVISILRLIKDYYARTGERQAFAAKPDGGDDTAPHRRASSYDISIIAAQYQALLSHSDLSLQDAFEYATSDSDDLEEIVRLVGDTAKESSSTLVALTELIIHRFISVEQRKSNRVFLAAFLDEVIDYVDKYGSNLNEFLKWLDVKLEKLSISSSPDIDAVTVMTIHKSKGLEADCVHYVLKNKENFKPRRDSQWYELPRRDIGIDLPPVLYIELTNKVAMCPEFKALKEIDENADRYDTLNTVYVAMTRACRELTIYGGGGESDATSTLTLKITHIHSDELPMSIDEETGEITIGEGTYPVEKEKKKADDKKPCDWLPAQSKLFSDCAIDYRENDKLKGLYSLDTVGEQLLDEIPDWSDDDEPVETSAKRKETDGERQARERGTRLHNILMYMNKGVTIRQATIKAASHFHMDDSVIDESVRILENAFAKPEAQPFIKRWFQDYDKSVAEQPIYTPKENVIDAFDEGDIKRPDRVIFNHDNTIDVIDYKFGVQHSEENKTQLTNYVNYISRINPDIPVRGYLWYLDQGEICQI